MSKTLDTALDYIGRGWAPVPIPPRKKGPVLSDWDKLHIDKENASTHFSGGENIGVRLGPISNGLTDVDLDCGEAVRLAPKFLPTTGAVFGRKSKPRSHYLYRVSEAPAKARIHHRDEAGATIVEIRLGGGGKAAQTVFPGSTHPTGEVISWDDSGDPALVSFNDLKLSVVRIAIASILTRHWPAQGGRHDAAMRTGGFLARAGWETQLIGDTVEAIAEVAGDDEVLNRREAAIAASNGLANGQPTFGLPAMVEAFGDRVVQLIANLIGFETPSVAFQTDSHGSPVRNQHNIRLAIGTLGVRLSHDVFQDRLLIEGLVGSGPVLDDRAMTNLWLLIDDRFRFRPGKDFFWDVVSNEARKHPVHPVCEYLSELKWDGVARLDRWLIDYCGAEDTAFVRAVGAITLIAAVRRVRRPGCKFDEMLVLESPQGKNKSTALAVLAVRDDWFSDDLPLNQDTQRTIERMTGRWIVEAGELKGMRRADIEHLKSFLSRTIDRARPAYGRMTMEVPRQSVIIGTTNSDRYLRDGTGNRRFWPVRVSEIDIQSLRRDRSQLWAEAACREGDGEGIRLDPSLWAEAGDQQDRRRVEDPFVGTLQKELGDLEGRIRSEDIWTILGVRAGQRNQDHNARLGDAMRELGWERDKFRFGGARPEWGYARGDRSARLVVSHDADGLWVGYEGEERPL